MQGESRRREREAEKESGFERKRVALRERGGESVRGGRESYFKCNQRSVVRPKIMIKTSLVVWREWWERVTENEKERVSVKLDT